ncbi:MAG TPA: OmpH family outer membrane protein [Bryobacteraceae bacterium]|jgi:outer membrane protein
MKFLLVPALALVSGAGLWGQATKVALINMQQAVAQTKEGQVQIGELQKKYGPKEQEFQKRAQEIQTKQDQLKKTQATLSDEAKANLEADITKLQTALQRDQQDTQTDSQEDEDRMVQGIYGKLVQATTKVAQANQIMLVFDVSSQPNNLVCCGSAMDITKQVVEEYDKANPSAGAAATTNAAPAGAAAPKTTPPPATRPPAANPAPKPPAGK